MYNLILALWIAATTLTTSVASAAVVDYTTTSMGENQYRYDYIIRNDGSLDSNAAIQIIDLLFDPLLYEEASLTNVSAIESTKDWTQQFFNSAPEIPIAFDLSTEGEGIKIGDAISGFAVQFHWLGSGAPGSQVFEVYAPDDFSLLEQGITTPIPLPAAWPMMLASILLFARAAQKHKFQS